MSGYLTSLAEVLRHAGLSVIEVDGWKTRARSSGGYADGRPWCIMWHHTASAPGTSADSNVNYICHGSPDRPLANLYLHHDGTWWVCAAGATNTNGKGRALDFSKGTVPADSMNTYAIGIEAGNSGVGEPWPEVMIDSYFAGSNALAAAYDLQPSDISSHQHYAPDRKIDPATASAVQGSWHPRSINSSGTWNVEDMRIEALDRATPAPEPTPPPNQEEDVEVVQIQVNGSNATFLGMQVGGKFILWMEWVNGGDAKQMERFDSYLQAEIKLVPLNWGDVKGIGLIGPVPQGDGLHDWTGDEFGNVLTG